VGTNRRIIFLQLILEMVKIMLLKMRRIDPPISPVYPHITSLYHDSATNLCPKLFEEWVRNMRETIATPSTNNT
jgi:hypothetical protein